MKDLLKKLRSNRRLALLGAMVGGLGLTAVAQARPHRGGPRGPGHHFVAMLESLDLSETQAFELYQMKKSAKTAGKGIRAATRADMKLLAEEMKKPSPNAELIHQKVDEAIERIRAQAHKMADEAISFHGSLSPEQKAELTKRISEKQERGQKMRKIWE